MVTSGRNDLRLVGVCTPARRTVRTRFVAYHSKLKRLAIYASKVLNHKCYSGVGWLTRRVTINMNKIYNLLLVKPRLKHSPARARASVCVGYELRTVAISHIWPCRTFTDAQHSNTSSMEAAPPRGADCAPHSRIQHIVCMIGYGTGTLDISCI